MKKRAATAALAVTLALAPAAPAWAAGDITVVYGGGQAVARTIEVDGTVYELSDWSASGAADASKKTFEQTREATVAAADYSGDAAASFPASVEVDEDGFKGEIPLAQATAEPSKTHENRTDYEVSDTFTNLSQKELDALPGKRTVEVGGQKLTLEKLDVSAERMPSDPDTAIYEGTVTYGVHEGAEVADEYKLTAVYRGELSRDASSGSVTAVYKPSASVAANPSATASGQRARREQEAAKAAQEEQKTQQQAAAEAGPRAGIDPAAAAIGGAAALAAALAAAWAVAGKLGLGKASRGQDGRGGGGPEAEEAGRPDDGADGQEARPEPSGESPAEEHEAEFGAVEWKDEPW